MFIWNVDYHLNEWDKKELYFKDRIIKILFVLQERIVEDAVSISANCKYVLLFSAFAYIILNFAVWTGI